MTVYMMKIFRFLLLVCGVGISSQAYAQSDITAENIRTWADEIFGKAQAEQKFSGAAITVVRGSDLIFSKGYGYADYVRQTPMDPANTKVRVCSNSKTMVATGLMQLIERGAIKSMDDPANKYLRRIQLPEFAGKPVTVRDLVTHRGGFEDSYFAAATETVVPTPVSSGVVKRLIPDVVRKPGTLSVYSNANTALQGVLIEDITGQLLRDYLSENIFAPLGMKNTSLNDNPPLPEGHAMPYAFWDDGSVTPVTPIAKHPLYAASGGVFSTAEDMSRFVSAHLTHGESTENPVLSAASFAQMHRPLVRNHAGLPSIGVNFFIEKLNGSRFISHGCGLPGFTTYLAFIPEKNIGVFISVVSKKGRVNWIDSVINSNKPDPVKPSYAAKFCYGFLREFIGFNPNTATPTLSAEAASVYAGTYMTDRRAYTNILRALDLWYGDIEPIHVAYDGKGGLTLNGSGPYVDQGNNIFRRGTHPASTYAFDMDEGGRALRLLRYGAFSATKVGFWDNPATMQSLVKILAAFMATGLLCLFYKGESRSARVLRFAPLASLVLFTSIMGAALLGHAPGTGIAEYVNNGYTLRLYFIAACSNLLLLLGLWQTGACIQVWKNRHGSLITRVHYGALSVALLGFIPVLFVFRLAGFQVP